MGVRRLLERGTTPTGYTPPPAQTGVSATRLLVYEPGLLQTITQAQAAKWVGLACTLIAADTGRMSALMGGSNTWSGGAGGSSLQAALASNGSAVNIHNVGGKMILGTKFDSGGTLGPAILGSWSDTGFGLSWYPGQLATASTTVTTTPGATITIPDNSSFSAGGGTFRAQTAIGIPAVVVTYTGKSGSTLVTGCSVASGTLTITSGVSLIAPGRIRESIQCFAAAAASLNADGILLDQEPYYAETHNPGFSTTLSSALTTGGPITSLPINTPAGSVVSGNPVILAEPGGNTQTFFASGPSTGSAVPVVSQTPNFAYPAATTTAQSGRLGWAWDASSPLSTTQATVNTNAQARGQDFMQWLADAWAAYATASNPTPSVAVIYSKTGFSATVLNNGSLNSSGIPQTPFTPNTQGSLDEAVEFSVNGGTGYQSSSPFQYFWAGTLAASSAGMPNAIWFATEKMYRGPAAGGSPYGCALPPSWSSTQGAAACCDMVLAYMQNTTLAALSQIAAPAAWAANRKLVRAIPGVWIDGDGSGGFNGFPDLIADINMLLGSGAVGKMPKWTASDAPIWLYQVTDGTLHQPYPNGATVGFSYDIGSRSGSTTPGTNYSNTDYRPPMTNVATPVTIDTHPPSFSTFSPVSGGSHTGALVITGIALPGSDGNPIASVKYSVNGGPTQEAILYPNMLSGAFTTGLTWRTDFAAAVTLGNPGGSNSVAFTITTVSGLTTQTTWTG